MSEVIRKYCQNYRIPLTISEADMLSHWEREQQMRIDLLSTPPQSRAAAFEKCYSELYAQFPWLNASPRRPASEFRIWHQAVGGSPQRIFEVGSGKGELIDSLAALGHDCTATEITSERGERWSSQGVRWVSSDGVHLDRTEESSYDVVLSNQVIEHLHPDDVRQHFSSCRNILRAGGRYIFATPHCSVGPCDVSALFGCRSPRGLHLKEYTYRELFQISKEIGFRGVECIFRLPTRLGRYSVAKPSSFYLAYQMSVEAGLSHFPLAIRRRSALLARALLFSPTIFMIAYK